MRTSHTISVRVGWGEGGDADAGEGPGEGGGGDVVVRRWDCVCVGCHPRFA